VAPRRLPKPIPVSNIICSDATPQSFNRMNSFGKRNIFHLLHTSEIGWLAAIVLRALPAYACKRNRAPFHDHPHPSHQSSRLPAHRFTMLRAPASKRSRANAGFIGGSIENRETLISANSSTTARLAAKILRLSSPGVAVAASSHPHINDLAPPSTESERVLDAPLPCREIAPRRERVRSALTRPPWTIAAGGKGAKKNSVLGRGAKAAN